MRPCVHTAVPKKKLVKLSEKCILVIFVLLQLCNRHGIKSTSLLQAGAKIRECT